jgi:hypothetical protein
MIMVVEPLGVAPMSSLVNGSTTPAKAVALAVAGADSLEPTDVTS